MDARPSRRQAREPVGDRAARADPAVREGTRSRLPVGGVVTAAARAGWHNAGRVLAVAVTVSMAAAVAEMALHELIDRADLPLAILADLTTSVVNLAGLVLLAGILSQVVGESGHGRPHATIGAVVTSLSWSRLIRADLLVALITGVGLLALVIPGLAALTFLAVTGPVVEIEHRPVLQALRRSAHLVRPHFWAVALTATVPTLIAGELPAALPQRDGPWQFVEFLAIRGVGEAVVEAAIGLLIVELAYQLIEADSRHAGQSPATVAPPLTEG